MPRPLIVFIILIATTLAGCSSSSPTLSSDSTEVATALSGTWNLVSIQPAGFTEQAKPDGAAYQVTIADGRLSMRADCNTCSAGFTLSGSTLAVGPALACTRAACPTMAFENNYTSVLGGEHTASVAGNMLVLSSPRGVLRFTR